MLNCTLNELNYLLDLFKEVKQGLDDGVLYEIEQAESMIQGWRRELITTTGNLSQLPEQDLNVLLLDAMEEEYNNE